MMIETNEYFEGSSADLIASGMKVNGEALDNVGISVLARFNVIQNVGKAEKVEGKRGKPGFVYRVPKNMVQFTQFSQVNNV